MLDGHLLQAGGIAARAVIVEEGRGFGESDILVEFGIFQLREPVAVDRLVVDQQAEGFVAVAVLQPVDGVVGDDIGHVTLLADEFGMLFRAELRIVVGALPVEYLVVVETLRHAPEMPFAKDCRLVSGLLQEFREGHLVGVESGRPAQFDLSVLVAVLARQQRGAAGRRDRIFDIGTREENAAGRKPVDVGGRSEFRHRTAVSADRLVRMVIAHDMDDVDRSGLLLGCRHARRRQQGRRHGNRK